MLKAFLKNILILVLFSTSAWSYITINSVTLNNTSSVTVNANDIINVKVTATNSNGTNWKSTAWFIDGVKTCVNTNNHNYDTTYQESFTINAPSSSGIYDISFRAYSDNWCNYNASNEYILDDGINVSSTGNGTEFSGENLREFTLLYKNDLYGDIKIFGNTILGEETRECLNYERECFWFWCRDVCTEYSEPIVGCVADGVNNAYVDTKYFDIDNDSSTYSSSSSDLILPTSSTVKKAYLYWQGLATADDYLDAKQIKLKVPNSTEYIDLVASPEKINWSTYGSYFPYQAMVEITEHMNGNGTYTVANLLTTEGQISGLGTFGAWSIVVVYENQNESLKNVAIYDGYVAIDDDNEQTINLSGFLTPTSGVVKSKFLVFAGEGDVDITGDYIQIDGTTLRRDSSDNGLNTFNSSITENGTLITTKNPSCTNNLGIDIHSYDVGSSGQDIIQNSQTSASVKLGSSGDMYYPSVFAFSTDLYIPDVCYEETISKDGDSSAPIYTGDLIDVEVYITNKSGEPAKGVSVKKVFGDENEYQRDSTKVYESSSFVSKTDADDSDVVKYLSDDNSLVLNLGTGATSQYGGIISYEQNETFSYQFTPQADGNITSAYLVTYTDESDANSVVTYSNVPIGKCSNRDITSTIVPVEPSGTVRIVEYGKNWNDYAGGLFTKIVGKEEQYDILFATDENGATLTSGEIKKIEILNIENESSPIVIATPLNSLTTINQRYTFNYTFTQAYKRLQFKITLDDDSIATSNDFSVRPASYSGTIDSYAGESISLTTANVLARNYPNSSNVTGYTKTLSTSNITQLFFDASKTCNKTTSADILDSFSASIVDGASQSGSVEFNDIGSFQMELLDKTWTNSSDDQGSSHCVEDSTSNAKNAEGKYGCDFDGNVTVNVNPYELNVTVASFDASNAQDWLYIANVDDMNVTASATVQANNKQHQPLQNFINTCYASDVDLSFYYSVTNPNSDVNLSYDSGLKESIVDINKTITIPASSFTSPSASTEYSFNVDRAYNAPLNPIDITLTDVKVTSTDVAKDENNATLSENKTFYYGRVSTKDITTNQQSITHPTYIEVYSTSKLGSWKQDSINWYMMEDDSLSSFVAIAPKSDFLYSSSNKTLSTTPSTSSGVIDTTITNSWSSSGDAFIHLDIPEYLWYNRYSDYNATNSCATHPCFRYIYKKQNQKDGVNSGVFDGSSIVEDRNYTGGYEKSGVKVFR